MNSKCHLDDDGGPEVRAVEEAGPPGVHRQSLHVRVGPVFDAPEPHDDFAPGIQRKEPGIWIEYQVEHDRSLLEGPVLLTPEVWYQLVRAVNRRLAWRKPWWRRILPG